MADYLELLAAKAFKIVPGPEYNKTLAELTEGGKNPEKLVFYEVALGEGKPWAWLRDHVYPALVNYLKNKSIDPEDPDRLVISVFWRDRCFLLAGRDFLSIFQEMEGINGPAFHFRVLRWLSQDRW